MSKVADKIAQAQKSSRSYLDVEHDNDDDDDDAPPSFSNPPYDDDDDEKRVGKGTGIGIGERYKDDKNARDKGNAQKSTNPSSSTQPLPSYARVKESNELDRVKLARELRIQHQKNRAREMQSNKAMKYWRWGYRGRLPIYTPYLNNL